MENPRAGMAYLIKKKVVQVYPEILFIVFNNCLKQAKFFRNLKKKLFKHILRKEEKPVDKSLSYPPLCLTDMPEKLLEEVTLTRLEKHINEEVTFLFNNTVLEIFEQQ